MTGIMNSIMKFFPFELGNKVLRNKLITPGTAAIVIISIISLLIWPLRTGIRGVSIWIVIAKSSAILGTVLFSLNFVLALRIYFLEHIFGGLDRLYKVHHITGKIALILLILHPIFLAIHNISSWDIILSYIVPGKNAGITPGILSIAALILLLILTIHVRLPYHTWLLTHKFIGIPLMLGFLHGLMAGSAIRINTFLLLWLSFFFIAGVISYAYMLFFYHIIGPRHHVIVDSVVLHDGITEITFRKNHEHIDFYPGQFVFVNFPGLGKKREKFPFSIANAPHEKKIRIAAKKSGDFTTEKLPEIKKGDNAVIHGPYGKFGESFLIKDSSMVWIAGGIGITPFMGMLNHLCHTEKKSQINLIWAVKNEKEAIYNDEVLKYSKKISGLNYTLWPSEKSGRLTLEKIKSIVGEDIKGKAFFICGPPAMMMGLSDELVKAGVKHSDIIFEDFSLI